MVYYCSHCSENFEDEWICIAHQELFHTSEPVRASVIHYAPPAHRSNTGNVQAHEEAKVFAEALEGYVVRHYQIKNVSNRDLNMFIAAIGKVIVNVVQKELARLNLIKFGLVLDATFINADYELSSRSFISRNRSVFADSNIEDIVKEIIQEIILKITEHEARGSGWSLLNVIGVDIRVHKHGYGDRGSSYIPLPKKIQNTVSCINVQNTDTACFKYAMLCKFVVGENPRRVDRRYRELECKYNFNGTSYPVSLSDVKQFERRNPNVSVNVFGLTDSNNVYPLKVAANELADHTDLLLIKQGDVSHYVYIKNFNRLVNSQFKKRGHAFTVCKRCFCYTSTHYNRGGRSWLTNHLMLCNQKPSVQIKLPTVGKNFTRFDKPQQQYRVPIVIYADFESLLLPVDTVNPDSKRIKYQEHQPNSYCLLIKSTLSEEHLERYGLTSRPYVYRGESAAQRFIDNLHEIIVKVENLYKEVLPMSNLDARQKHEHDSSSHCYLCGTVFTVDNYKVRDHDHLTGLYRGAACNSCNLNYKLPKFLPVVMHNLSGYDSHYIIPELGRHAGSIDVLATTTEKFISFSKRIGKLKLRFLDSYRFMPSSLLTLVGNLDEKDLVETKKLVPHQHLQLVIRKGIFPYDYIDSLRRFEETQLPPRAAFYSKLNEEEISEDDYIHASNVWEKLQMRTLGDYNNFYVTLDVTLLCDVMEQFRNTCITAYGLDPLHSYTSPGLAWQAMLKDTKCTLELLTDIDMMLMVESAVRGGITQSVTRYIKANNKYLPDYNNSNDSVYISYLDANNLYGWAMSKPLPSGDFKWIDPNLVGDISTIPPYGDVGYIFECDFEYPDNLHDHHYDLPLLPRALVPPTGKHHKLMLTVDNKPRYIAHYWVVQQALQLGLRLTKIHRAIQFCQSCWLKPYIDANTQRRAAATSSFQKDFFKLMNNSIFGKSLQNSRKHKNVKLVTEAKKLEKLVQKPNFRTSIVINERLVIVCMDKTVVKMDRPLYVGMSILDISKTLMYDFHYNKMVSYYGRENIGISYMDTDAFIYWIKTLDLYNDFRTFPYTDAFDFSDYPIDHPTYDNAINKKVLGKFKDETNGVVIQEIVALMSKVYALKLANESGPAKEIKKAKGVKSGYVKKKLQFEHYRKCLFEKTTHTASFNAIRSFKHQLYSVTEVKRCLSWHDDKRHITEDCINTLPYGHYKLRPMGQDDNMDGNSDLQELALML